MESNKESPFYILDIENRAALSRTVFSMLWIASRKHAVNHHAFFLVRKIRKQEEPRQEVKKRE